MSTKEEILEDMLSLAGRMKTEADKGETIRGAELEEFVRKLEVLLKDMDEYSLPERHELLADVLCKVEETHGTLFFTWFSKFMRDVMGSRDASKSGDTELVMFLYGVAVKKAEELGMSPINLLGCLEYVKAMIRKEHIAVGTKGKKIKSY